LIDTHFEANLPHTAAAPGIARRSLTAWLTPVLESGELEVARLLVSELVTNAVVHGRGVITVRAQIDDDRLLVEVIDEGGGFERTVRQRDFESLGGRGLAIVDTAASRWGIHEGTTHVWFELERPGPRLGAAGKPAG
jgi:anti-sigma regulatory factor (Ser/Thr protein kinase)